ncbi:LON peptidase N-terminal domain and RING finger protein 3 [Morus notabilis]|uniref:LON peptidase N-terminal domain and RING finger protein 3 n=1 Tax=Morus notabilis TaxID=981085 RepID=W9QRR8_9ROSA|nr:LON peptidase N-terminal domain and RING finger protein 3 [Morus notabilis]
MSHGDVVSPSLFAADGIDDVDDYISLSGQCEIQGKVAHDGGQSLPRDTFDHVFDLVQRGNRAFRENRYEEAINCYSRANSIKPSDPVILGNRCAAYIRISKFLMHRPPSASEYRPLNGLDPTTHAELALKDADKLINLRSNLVKSYILKAGALILLEKYEMARDVILSGLQVDPFSNSLKTSLQNLERTQGNLRGRRDHGRPERTDDFDCTLCNKCPLCRTVLFISPRTCSTSVTLNNIIQKNFPEEYAERRTEHQSLTNLGVDLMPLFVMDVVIPCQKFPLHIFEPRYRLMVRRIMEGNHRMGMVIVDPNTGTLADFACEVEITEYRVAEIECVQDIYPPEGSEERADLQETTNNAVEYARSWITRAKEAAQFDQRKLEKIHNLESMMPTAQDPERFSFWLATLTNRRPHERLELLRMRDTKERMTRGLIYLRAEQQGCRVQ